MYEPLDFEFNQPPPPGSAYSYLVPEPSDCMRCGLCLNTCPTYQLEATDAESPRWRIRTLSRLLFDKQTLTEQEQTHLKNCVQCRTCESVCPSKMAYGQLFDSALAQLTTKKPFLAKLGFWLISHKHWRYLLLPFVELYRRFKLSTLIRATGLLAKLRLTEIDSLLIQPMLSPLKSHYPTKTQRVGRVALFTGCLTEHFDRATHLATIKLLNALGYEVVIPFEQRCCGAIHKHNGESEQALVNANIAIFNGLDIDAIIYTATGCGATLADYPDNAFKHPLYDINDYLVQQNVNSLRFAPLPIHAVVHEPCSQRNLTKSQASVYPLLQNIPGLTVSPLADNAICCGAGGSYMLTHPMQAQQLRKLKQKVIKDANAELVISSNFGCILHLQAPQLHLLHPVCLLAQQLLDK